MPGAVHNSLPGLQELTGGEEIRTVTQVNGPCQYNVVGAELEVCIGDTEYK